MKVVSFRAERVENSAALVEVLIDGVPWSFPGRCWLMTGDEIHVPVPLPDDPDAKWVTRMDFRGLG